MYNKCNVFESSLNHPPPMSMEKLCSTNLIPGAKNIGDCCSTVFKGNKASNQVILKLFEIKKLFVAYLQFFCKFKTIPPKCFVFIT